MTPIKQKRVFTVKEILDANIPFREWIEGTKLFNVIKQESNPKTRVFHVGFAASLVSDEISINLIDGIIINTAYDLPIELIQNFFYNSPFINLDAREEITDNYLPLKLLENDDR